jgi:putative tricarboxylic transport membrane protein
MSVALAGYLALFNVVGFILATAVFLTALFLFLGERRIWVAGVAAVAIAIATMAVFSSALNVNLPRGPFGF